MNSKVTSDGTILEELVGQDGQQIPNFPRQVLRYVLWRVSEITSCKSLCSANTNLGLSRGATVNEILVALGLPTGGRIDARKDRLRRHIGLTVL